MAEKKQGQAVFSRIGSRDDALRLVRDASLGFFIVAAIQGGIGVFLAPEMLVDALLFAVLAGILMKWKSRTAAVLLLVLSVMAFIVTVLNRMGVMAEGGGNIILAVIILWVAVRAVEAAFKLQGRFKEEAVSGVVVSDKQ